MCARGRGKIRKYWCLSAGMGVGLRYATNYSQKEKHFSCLGCIAKEVRGIKCSKKEIQVRQQENLCKDKGNAD